MAPYTNSFFSNTTGFSGETLLLDDLCREQIKMFGIDLLYMPRHLMNYDKLLHESSKSAFEFAMPIPMYIKSFSGFQNGMELLTKFGVRDSSELTLAMSKSEWNAYYGPFVKSYYNSKAGRDLNAIPDHLEGETAQRPKEGDVIYFPYDDSLFEVKYVNFDEPFYQLGKGYVYELQVEKFEFSGEHFSTDYVKPDEVQTLTDYYQLKFDTIPNGVNSFEFNEQITIYDITTIPIQLPQTIDGDQTIDGGQTLDGGFAYVKAFQDLIEGEIDGSSAYLKNPPDFILDGGHAVIDEEPVYEGSGEDFRLYKDPGYRWPVPFVTGTVMKWNALKNELIVTNLSNLNPDQQDENEDVNVNDFDRVIIFGQESGAIWYSKKAQEKRIAFDDGRTIQEEFDQIKIIDEFDKNPFGFV